MKFYKHIRGKSGGEMVEADGEPWEKNGVTFMIESPKDETDCDIYEMCGSCGKCLVRYECGCPLELFRATEKGTGLLVATTRSKSALTRALNRLDYDAVKEVIAAKTAREG